MNLLESLGYNASNINFGTNPNLNDNSVGRVIKQFKDRYVIITENGEFEAEITGNLRYTTRSSSDLPVAGDWVNIRTFDDQFALIHAVSPRTTFLARQKINKFGEHQIIAANIDFALIVQAVDRDYNINRLERYITLAHSGKIRPVVILNKTDLIAPKVLNDKISSIQKRLPDVPVISTCIHNSQDIDGLKRIFQYGKTYCFIGSSGVGKSSLINAIFNADHLKTNKISTATGKGKHTTTHKELMILKSGGVIIDTPGMREIGVTENADATAVTFSQIEELSASCKFKDCSHTSEPGCAVLSALGKGEIDSNARPAGYGN